MKIDSKTDTKVEADMTPMIDMTFQLIAFFMVLINFSEADQVARVQLPQSVLAKPPDGPIENAIYIHMTAAGTAIYGGEDLSLDALSAVLTRERKVMAMENKKVADATIIIRADADAPTGMVQELIQVCQDEGFERFALRVKEKKDFGYRSYQPHGPDFATRARTSGLHLMKEHGSFITV